MYSRVQQMVKTSPLEYLTTLLSMLKSLNLNKELRMGEAEIACICLKHHESAVKGKG